MLAYVEACFRPEIFAKVTGGFPKKESYINEEVWWLPSCYYEVIDEEKADEVREKAIQKMREKVDKYRAGDICPYGDFLFPRYFVEKPELIPNFKRIEIKLLKDMPTEEVLKIATIPQILQEFGELKIR